MASFLLRRRYVGWLNGTGSTVSAPSEGRAISASTGATGSSLIILTGLALTRSGFSPARAWSRLNRSRAAQNPHRDRCKIPPPPQDHKNAGGKRHPDLADQVLNGLRRKGFFEQDRIAWRVGQQREAEEQGHGEEHQPSQLMAGPCRSAF